MIIGIGHAARVGKDSLGAVLVKDHGFTRLSFADALRDVAHRSHPKVRRLVDQFGWDSAKTTYPVVRQYLIDLGNAARVVIGEGVWVQAVASQMAPGRDYVITDVRYLNEAEWVKSIGGSVVKVERPGFSPLNDVADLALATYTEWDYTVHNDGTLEDLVGKAAAMVTQLHPTYSGYSGGDV